MGDWRSCATFDSDTAVAASIRRANFVTRPELLKASSLRRVPGKSGAAGLAERPYVQAVALTQTGGRTFVALPFGDARRRDRVFECRRVRELLSLAVPSWRAVLLAFDVLMLDGEDWTGNVAALNASACCSDHAGAWNRAFATWTTSTRAACHSSSPCEIR